MLRLSVIAVLVVVGSGCSVEETAAPPPSKPATVAPGCENGVPEPGEVCLRDVRVIASAPASAVAMADFDGDGDVDLAVAGAAELVLWSGDRTGALVAGAPVALSQMSAMVACDVDGDGIDDVVVANGSEVAVVRGASVTLSNVGGHAIDIACGDFDGDGVIDLATADEAMNRAAWIRGHGDGTFAPTAVIGDMWTATPNAVTVGDFDGDGHDDIAVATDYWHYVGVLLGNGDGTFAPLSGGSIVPVGDHPRDIAAADVDEDGALDFVTPGVVGDDAWVVRGNGKGDFAEPERFGVGAEPRALAVADLDADGALDLVTVNDASADATVLLGDGDGFGRGFAFAAGSSPRAIAIGDLNGDRELDVVLAGDAVTSFLSSP